MEAEGSCIPPKIRRNGSASANISSLGLQSNPTNPAPVKHITSWPFDEKLLIQALYKEKNKKDDKGQNNNVQDSQDEEEEIEQERVITLRPLNMQDFKVAKSQKYRLNLKKYSCVANQQPNNMLSQFSPSCNDIWSKSYLPNCGTLQGGNLSGASSITPLSSQPHKSLTDMNSQGWINHNHDDSYHSPKIGNSSVDSLIPIDVAEPEGSLDFSFCDSLQMNHDWIAYLTEEAQSSGISNDLFSLEDLFSDMINEETRLGNQFGAVHTIIM